MTRKCTWLHISDIHFRAADNWRDSVARQSLLQCFLTQFSETSLPKPDLILCTGDVGFGDSSNQKLADQYEDALKFFDELLRVTGLPRERLFIVPGNHDVARSAVNKRAEAEYRRMAKEYWLFSGEINSAVGNVEREYCEAVMRLADFKKFLTTACPHIDLHESHLHYTQNVALEDFDVQVIGLNSAWCCNGTEEDRDVWVGAQAQLASVNQDGSLRIGLMHHPLEWLTKSDASLIEGRMGRQLHVLLHGHEHEFREHQFDGFPVIGTGAVSAEKELEHGVVLAQLDVGSAQLTRHLFVYSPLEGLWRKSARCEKKLVFPVAEVFTQANLCSPATSALQKEREPYSQYFSRPGRLGDSGEIDDYIEAIEPSAGAHNRDSQYFQHLWSDSMGPHTIEVLAGDPNELHYDGVFSSTRIVQKDNLDAYFLRNLVIPPDMTATANDDETDKKDARLSFAAFVKEVSESPKGGSANHVDMHDSENRVRYLVGDAGIGKTLTVLKMIDDLRQNPYDQYGYKVVPVYVDLHQDRTWYEMEPARAVHSTIDRIGRMLHAALPDDQKEKSPFSAPDFVNTHLLDLAVRVVAGLLTESKMAPLIIFDNGDRFFFENARYRFFQDFARRRDWHLDDTFVALVDRFVLEANLGKIGASVLFVCRKYVYGHCLRISDGADPIGPIRKDHKVYQLLTAKHADVLDSRFRLISDAVKAIGGKYRNANMFEERVGRLHRRLEALHRNVGPSHESALRTLWGLVHQGHRSWLHFFASLPIDVGPGAEVADRIFSSPYILLRLYITNMRKRFTQRQGHFPNLFLNDALILPSLIYPEAHRKHLHSYWLKFLLLKYVAMRRRDRKPGQVSSETLVEIFVSTFKYEEHLVRLALGSLSDPATSSCLHIVRPDRLIRHIEVLKLSDRGSTLVGDGTSEKPLCFSFDYLQLVTDDYLMALPRIAASSIYVDADLGHTLKTGSAYARGARETLRKKVPAVLNFFRVLEISFNEEARTHGTLKALQIEKMIPDFPQLSNDLLDAMGRVDSHFDGIREADPLPNPRELWKQICGNEKLEKAIQAYYRTAVPVSL